MLNTNVLVITLALFSVFSSEAKRPKNYKRPSYFPTCYRNDPNFKTCLLEATDKVRSFLVKGVPELRLPSIEPLELKQIELKQGSGSLNFKAIIKKIFIHGLSSYKFTKFDLDLPNGKLLCEGKVSALKLNGDYAVTGQILAAPIKGDGKFTTETESSEFSIKMEYKEETFEGGKTYYVVTDLKTSIDIKKPKVHLDGLFDGNQELNDATNRIINENIDLLYNEIKPVIEKIMNEFMEGTLFKTILRIPADELYPLSPDFN